MAGEEGRDGSMSGEKFIPVTLMKEAKTRRSGLGYHRGESGLISVRP